jgi:NAD(P)-dependent dehydrogenase (short-subunit alcohol dehydrogenase family)
MAYVEEMFGLEGTKVVVTGGAGVIAGAMSEALLNAGASVSVWGRGTNHPVSEAVERLEATCDARGRVFGETVDTGNEDDVAAALERTEASMGMPDVLVNGVGGNRGKSPFVDIDVETFESVLSMNLSAGLVIPTKVFCRRWIDAKVKGSVINLSSMTSYIPLSGVWAYNAAKSAVLNLTVGSAREFAEHDIRVNGIAPGFFLGYQNKDLLVANDETGELTARGQAIIDHTPYGRFGEVSELAGATLFLASRKASGFVTGVTIPVDGGYLTHNI